MQIPRKILHLSTLKYASVFLVLLTISFDAGVWTTSIDTAVDTGLGHEGSPGIFARSMEYAGGAYGSSDFLAAPGTEFISLTQADVSGYGDIKPAAVDSHAAPVVPIPASAWLLVSGLAGLLVIFRHKA